VREEFSDRASTRQIVRQETGPVHVRIIQTPVQSPDSRSLAFSPSLRLPHEFDRHSKPMRIIDGFQPSWSLRRQNAWCSCAGCARPGHVWLIDASGGEAVARERGAGLLHLACSSRRTVERCRFALE